MRYWRNLDQDRDSLLVKRRNDNHSPGPVIRELVPSSHQRSELSNTIFCIFSRWDQRIGESMRFCDITKLKLPDFMIWQNQISDITESLWMFWYRKIDYLISQNQLNTNSFFYFVISQFHFLISDITKSIGLYYKIPGLWYHIIVWYRNIELVISQLFDIAIVISQNNSDFLLPHTQFVMSEIIFFLYQKIHLLISEIIAAVFCDL